MTSPACWKARPTRFVTSGNSPTTATVGVGKMPLPSVSL